MSTENNERNEQVKLQEKVEKWWNSLDYAYKVELMEDFYPDRSHIDDADVLWNGLDWRDKLDIYQEVEGFKVRR